MSIEEKLEASDRGIGSLGALVLLLWCGIALAFSGSAFRIDEPNMLAVARQIAAEPLDPYGFEINWLGSSEPAFNILSNPPLLPYWLAAWASIFGWTESAIRMAMLPFGILLLFSAMRLAGLFQAPPLWIAGALIASPVFVLSGILAMPDLPAAALATVALAGAIRYARYGGWGPLIVGILAAGAAPLFKYNAITLVAPLAVLLIPAGERRIGRAVLTAAPAIGALLWSGISLFWYGEAHVLASARFQAAGSDTNVVAALLPLIGLAVVPLPLLTMGAERGGTWRAMLLLGAAAAGGMGGWLFGYPTYAVVLVGVGTSLGLLALLRAGELVWPGELHRLERLALAAWVLATLLLQFRLVLLATRYLLPVLVPLAILLWPGVRGSTRRRGIALAVLVVFALALALGDVRQGNLYRDAMKRIRTDGRLLVDGHWGFQFYAGLGGGEQVERGEIPVLQPNDVMVRASRAAPSGVRPVAAPGLALKTSRLELDPRWVLRTIDCDGANFHATVIAGCEGVFFTHLPFAASSGPAETLAIFETTDPAEPPH